MAKIRVLSGKLVNPFDLKPEDMLPYEMLHAVCLINRFTGQSQWPYSVGQHIRNLTLWVPEHLRKAAIVHDLSEAFFNDLSSPVKAECPTYKHAEHAAGERIARHFGVPRWDINALDEYDKRIYTDERDVLFPVIGERGDRVDTFSKPLGIPKHWVHEEKWQSVERTLQLQWENIMPEYDFMTGEYIG